MQNAITKLKLKNILQKYRLVIILILIILISSLISEHFLSLTNFINIIRQISMVAIIAVGSTVIIVNGGIDLSVGSVAAFSGVLFAGLVANNNFPMLIAVLITLIFGAVAGLVNGGVTVSFSVPPFIVTLATMYIFRGLAYIYTGGGYPISNVPKNFDILGRGYLAYIPIPIIVMALIFCIFIWFLNYTKYGLYIYCVGGNETASKLFGVNVKLVKLMSYVIGSVLASLGGIILASRLNSGQPAAGENFLFMAITATILGGTSLTGGEGTLVGTLLGAVILGLLTNILTLKNVNYFYQLVVQGIVLMAAVIIDVLLVKRTKDND
jgi:ribose/xylose/arabinose/galactoside ABC-type transport system permease subunit